MTKSLMLSIQPKHLANVLNGYKKLELRKTVPKDFKGKWVYIYCTKSIKDILYKYKDKYYTQHHLTFTDCVDVLNGKVVAKFWFDEYETYNHGVSLYTDFAEYSIMYDDLEKLCLDYREIKDYGKGKDLYAWHIKKLEVFDKPMELSDFYRQLNYPNGEVITPNVCEFSPFDYDNDLETCLDSFRLKKAPQSYQFVYTKEE